MVEPFLAIANFLLPQSTASSRPLLAINSLIPRLSLSLVASFQTDTMSRAHSTSSNSNGKRKGKAALGNDHALFEHSDWLHIAQRKFVVSYLTVSSTPTPTYMSCDFQTAPFTALAAFGPRATVRIPLRPTPPLFPRPQNTLHPASGKAKTYGISAAKLRRYGTATRARPTTYHRPP
jgi:hypothetical protein